jgi:hypothetical protein
LNRDKKEILKLNSDLSKFISTKFDGAPIFIISTFGKYKNGLLKNKTAAKNFS